MERRMNRMLIVLLTLSFIFGSLKVFSKENKRPNFIIILTDDQGYADIGCYGSTRVKTPNLDKMASDGIRFTNFYAQNVCGPSRASLMSGCYPIRVAEPGNQKYQHTILHPKEITIAEKLKESGYATACIGKWHLGQRDKNSANGWNAETMPNAQGFDYFYGTPLYNGFTPFIIPNKGFRSQVLRNSEVVIDKVNNWDFITGKYTEEALSWISRNKDTPFFLYLAHNMPHVPLGAGPGFKGKNPGDPYADAVEEIDWSVGEILKYLKENNLYDNTIVIFFSDNGPWIETTHGNNPQGEPFIPLEHSGTAIPLRGYKMLSWDGGHRVPCLVQWPGKIPSGKVVDEIITSMDFYPTLTKFATGKQDKKNSCDGMDITPVLLHPDKIHHPDRVYYYYVYTHLQAVRKGNWKLVLPRPEFPEWTGFAGRFYGDNVDSLELYNLDRDVSETENLAGRHPEIVKQMMKLVYKARAEMGDYNQTGTKARFYDDTPRRPEMAKWVN